MSVLFVLVIGLEFAAVPARQARLASRLAAGVYPVILQVIYRGNHDRHGTGSRGEELSQAVAPTRPVPLRGLGPRRRSQAHSLTGQASCRGRPGVQTASSNRQPN